MIYRNVTYGWSKIGSVFSWYLPTDKFQRKLAATNSDDAEKEIKKEIDKIVESKIKP